jgi:pimeloyl-ACP methyl ester carboxylesterase
MMTGDILLVHGGLYEGMTARRFWIDTSVTEAFARLGFRVMAQDRIQAPRSWEEEASHLLDQLAGIPSVHVLAASNGCSAAARLAAQAPHRVRSLLLCWPATAGDPQVDAATRNEMIEAGCPPEAASDLLSGEILRGLSGSELAALPMPVGIITPDPPDHYHQRRTVDRLLETIPNAIELGAFPHPFAPGFHEALPDFCRQVSQFIRT